MDAAKGDAPSGLIVACCAGIGCAASYDRSQKLPLYAKANIAEVWIVDLNKKQIEQFSQPHEDQYKQHAIVPRGKQIVATLLPAVAFHTEQLFS